jgi:hypothetical protein
MSTFKQFLLDTPTIKFAAVFIGKRPTEAFGGGHRQFVWRCTVERDQNYYDFDYHLGSAHCRRVGDKEIPNTPKAHEVLACLASDCRAADQ